MGRAGGERMGANDANPVLMSKILRKVYKLKP